MMAMAWHANYFWGIIFSNLKKKQSWKSHSSKQTLPDLQL